MSDLPIKAWMHHANDICCTTDPTAYENARPLVLLSDVQDRIEWIELGIQEWRDQYMSANRKAISARATASSAIEYLRDVLSHSSTEDAIRWLESIGVSLPEVKAEEPALSPCGK